MSSVENKNNVGAGQESVLSLSPEERVQLLAPLAEMREVRTELGKLTPAQLANREVVTGILNHAREVYESAEFSRKTLALSELLKHFGAFSLGEIEAAAGLIPVSEENTKKHKGLRSLFSRK